MEAIKIEDIRTNLCCAVCKSKDGVSFLTITDCHLCEKCQSKLAISFQEAMTIDRSNDPEY